MAKRYSQKQKDDVVAFIQKFNEENGRGGQAAAAKKWKLNPITLKSWMEKAGVSSPGKSARKKKSAGKKSTTVRRTTRTAKSTGGSVAGTLKRMMQIQEEIGALQSEYDKLKGSL